MEKSFEITSEVMDKINSFAVEPLEAKDVYCFSVTLCDNDIDRDGERFSAEALRGLAKLFVGKTGIFDHDPRGEKQTARIFDTSVEAQPERFTSDGQPYFALCARAYMVRTSSNADLIREISGGIKKEVSVSCSVAKQVCSVCGADRTKTACSHIKGRHYGEKLCFVTLEQPTDAYEWSFVAVPAQVSAGVTKHYDNIRRDESKQVSKLKGELGEASRKLCTACDFIRGEILRLSYFCKPFYTTEEIVKMTENMDLYKLLEVRRTFEKQMQERKDFIESDEQSFISRIPINDENNNYTI